MGLVNKVPFVVWVMGAIIAVAIVASFVILAITGKDSTPLTDFLSKDVVSIGAAIIGLINLVKLQHVQSQTDGTAANLLAINTTQSGMLSNSTPNVQLSRPQSLPANETEAELKA